MNNQSQIWVRCAGAAGSLGGLIWGLAIVAMATRTPGVPGLSYRDTTDLTLPMELAVVLMVVGLVGLYRASARRTGPLATAAVTLACSGLVFLVAGAALVALGDDVGRAVALPGAFGATLGFALFGIAVWRAGCARRIEGLLLCASALLLLGFNTEDWRAWLGLPFGAAWLWLGGVLLTTSIRSRTRAIVPPALSLLLVLGHLLGGIPNLGAALAHAASAPTPASLLLTGTNAFAEAPHAADLNLGGDWTIETWFKDDSPDGFGHPPRVLLTKGNPLVDRQVPYGLAIGWNVLAAGDRSGTGGRLITYDLAAAGIDPGAWHHVAVTQQSATGTLALYVDGVSVGQKTASSTTSTGNSRPLSIGRDGGGGFYWRGKLDDIRLWNVARSATDVASSYRKPLAGVEPGLVANWKLDDGTGLTAADMVGAHTASLSGGARWSTDTPFLPAPGSTPSPTPVASGTTTPTSTPVIVRTASPTPTGSPTASATPSSTATSTTAPTAPSTATPTATPAATSTSSPTPSATATPTAPPVALPPDPAGIASAINRGVATDLASASQFLYTGSNPIQTGVGPGTIDARRVAVLRGRVLTPSDAPLPGVTIAVLNHAELGRTFSRADGMFDLAVNGGGPLTLTYTLPGYPAVQRQVQAPWRDYAWLPDVSLVPLDTHITAIDLSSTAPVQVARGAVVVDADGARQATLLFAQGTTAQLTLPGGATQPLGTLHVRATEYTAGANGSRAMPADLPPTSDYTYAVELSVDEAINVGASGVAFNQPVAFYLDNFLHFKPGTIVPVGSYDRSIGQWVPSDNGRVIQILGVQGGLASLDVDGSGQPANASSLAALGITDAERQQLASLYSPAQSVWRAPLSHFSSWDLNWGSGPPDDATRPNQPAPTGDEQPDHPSVQCGSIIGCENQTLGEVVDLAGTSLALHYSGDRVPGRTAASTVRIPLSGASVPQSLTRIDLEVQVAGRKFNQSFGPGSNQSTTFTWDGKDAYGRVLQGSQPIRIGVGFAYQAVYKSSAQLGQVFGTFGDALIGNRARNETVLWQWSQRSIGSWDARPDGLGGWSVDAQHSYDLAGGVLYLGNGARRDVQGQYVPLKTIAGVDHGGFGGDGAPAGGAVFHQPAGLAMGPDGSVYIADSNNSRVRRIDPNGVISTVAGNGQFCSSTLACGDGGPATAAALCTPWSLAFGSDGSLFIADSGCDKVRRVSPTGIITTVAGTGEEGATGDGGPAVQATFHTPYGIAVGPDGAVYVADWGNSRVRRINTQTGVIQTVVGTGTSGFAGDNGPASRSQISFPFALAFGADGSLYIADWGNSRVRRVAADGVITTFAGSGLRQGDSGDGGLATHAVISDPTSLAVDAADGSVYVASNGWRVWRVLPDGIAVTAAGTGNCCAYTDGLPATQALLSAPRGVAVGQDRALYISDNSRIRRAAASLPGFSGTDIAIASEDGREVFQFDPLGRHLQTVDALSGATRYRFAYDIAGRLVSVTDDYGNTTSVEHDGTGNPAAIVAPGGQRTALSTDMNGFLATIADPAGQTLRLASAANGLLSSLTDPRGNVHSFTYDTSGRLTSDSDPVGGAKTLVRTELANGNYSVQLTSKLNRVTSYQVERLSSGGQLRTVTEPGGAVTRVTINTDGSRQVNNPDGSIDAIVYGPDPRWGMQAPIVSNVSRTSPGGAVETVTASRAVTLQDDKNLLSLLLQTDTLTVNGNTFRQAYDAAAHTLTFTSPEGRQQTAVLDAHGRIINQLLAFGQDPRTFTYDARGRLVAARQGSLATTFAYDTLNRLVSSTDMAGTTRQFTYDAADRPTRIAQAPGGQALGIAYDASGNRTHLTLPMGGDHAFGYSASDQATSYTPPGNPSFSVAYDLDGNALRATLPTGRVVDTSYDTAGRSTSTVYPEATLARTYADPTSRLGHLTRTPTGGGASEDVAFTFDGGLVTSVAWTGAAAGNFAYIYDASRRPTLIRLTSGADTLQTALAYDRDGLLTGLGPFTIARGGPAGAASTVSDGTLAESLSYDSEARETGRVLAVHGQQSYSLQLVYDSANRISQRIETEAGAAHTVSYTYDADGQLIQAIRDGQVVETYTYDLDGNRISRTVGSALTETATYDAQDRLVQRGSITYRFDADGFLTARGGDTFQYSARGELVSATIGGSTITYAYDGVGRRVARTDAAGTTQYLYGDLARPYLATAVRSPAGVLTGLYYDQSDRLFALERGGTRFYVATDQAGTPKIVLDANAASVRVLDYDSFGHLLADSNPSFDLPIGFGGGLADAATGLVRLGLRDYDPEAGRWTARDPLLFGASQTNLYAYVNSDPINWRDPSGTDGQSATSWYQSVATRLTDVVSNWIHNKFSSVPVGPVSISSDKPEVSVGGKAGLQVDGIDVVSADAEAAVGISTTGTACDPLFTYRFKLGAQIPALTKIPWAGKFFKADLVSLDGKFGQVENYHGLTTSITAANSPEVTNAERY